MATSKVFTVRLPDDQVSQLQKLAAFDNVHLAAEIREAVKRLIDDRYRDPEFKARVQAAFNEARELLEELGSGDPQEAAVVTEALRPSEVIERLTAEVPVRANELVGA